MRYLTAGLVALYLLCAGGIAAGLLDSDLAAWTPYLLAGKLAVVLVALVAGILSARPQWTLPALAAAAASTLAIPYPLHTGVAAAALFGAFLIWRTALSRRASLTLVAASYAFALLAVVLPRLQPGMRFNVMMVLFIVVFILFAGVIASLFTWLFIKVFEALDRSFVHSFLYLLPLLGAPCYLLARVILPLLPTGTAPPPLPGPGAGSRCGPDDWSLAAGCRPSPWTSPGPPTFRATGSVEAAALSTGCTDSPHPSAATIA